MIKKFFTFAAGNWLGILFGIITTPILTRILSPEEFGQASMYLLVINTLGPMLLLGTVDTYSRFFYEEKEELRGNLLHNSLKYPMIVTLVVGIIGLFFYKWIGNFLFKDPDFSIVLIMVIGLFFHHLQLFTDYVLRLNEKYKLYSVFTFSRKFFEFLLVIILYYMIGKTYKIVIYSGFLSIIATVIIGIGFNLESWKKGEGTPRHTQVEIMKYSFPLLLNKMVIWLFFSFDQIAIKLWSDYSELGVYSAALKLMAILTILQGTISSFIIPRQLKRYEEDPEDRGYFTKTTMVVTGVMFAIAIGTMMFRDLAHIVLGDSYKEAIYVIPILTMAPVLNCMSETLSQGINFAKKPKWHFIASLVASVVNIGLNFILVPKFGAKGAAIATAIAWVGFFVVKVSVSMKYYYYEYDRNKIIVGLSFLMMMGTYLAFNDGNIKSYIALFIGLGVVGVYYGKKIKEFKSIS
jgi:O-antigen/teichoic acid export membrane protein